ncbi:hypothetical protein B0O99DRAFT_530488 [Bisporella sp. PMI_857]|nr:hypothetical protein B0O99DRAFT_530488 [Bisporella sp. PMI_857]
MIQLHDQPEMYELCLQRCEDMITLANEKFYAFPFKNVPPCWRHLHREASLFKFSTLALSNIWKAGPGLEEASTLENCMLDDMVRTLDMTLIMAGPPEDTAIAYGIAQAFATLQSCHDKEPRGYQLSAASKRQKLGACDLIEPEERFPEVSFQISPVKNNIPRKANPSFDVFESYMLEPRNKGLGPEPVILTDVINKWPARNGRSWSNPNYFMSKTIGGRRLVPVETGRTYVDEGWGQEIISFKEFMENYILVDSSTSKLSTGYLAQHDLFAQIPSLRLDITVPDYCYTSPPPPHFSSPLATKHAELPALDDPLLNAWFGPAGTISPLHTDPYHNILAQVVGRKYVRLYAPRESEKLYARGVENGGIDMENTSAVDIGILAGWDGTPEEQAAAHDKYPLCGDAKFVDCVLEEGECLYIPVGWWHYVRSLSVSFSVSFWFN